MPKRNRFKTTDSAATVPGRATFPQGTYYQQTVPSYVNAPPSLGSNYGTAAIGAAGTPYSGYPTGQSGTFTSGAGVARTPYASQNKGAYLGNGVYLPSSAQTNKPLGTSPSGAGSFVGGGGSANVASQFPWLNNMPNNGTTTQTPYNPLAATLRYGQYINAQGNVQRGTTPFGVNAQGQRLDNQGNVFDPATAKRDIYGGQFIQEGEKRWERVNGKLRQVVYMGGGKKKVIKGNKGSGGGGGGGADSSGGEPTNYTAEQFISFRA